MARVLLCRMHVLWRSTQGQSTQDSCRVRVFRPQDYIFGHVLVSALKLLNSLIF